MIFNTHGILIGTIMARFFEIKNTEKMPTEIVKVICQGTASLKLKSNSYNSETKN